MNTKNQSPTADAYRPFSNGSEFDNWTYHNCSTCQWGSVEGIPHCCGEYGLINALIGDGNVPVMALDFIGTTKRYVHQNGAFCTLNDTCSRWEYAKDESEDTLKDVEIREAMEAAYARHGYKLTDMLRKIETMNRFPF